jgi:hypothetical protein
VRDQPSLTTTTTSPSLPLMSSETVPLDAYLRWADGGSSPSPLPPPLLSSFFARLFYGAIESAGRELERISATLMDAAQAYSALAASAASSTSTSTATMEPVYVLSAAWWHAWCDYVGAGPAVRGYPRPTKHNNNTAGVAGAYTNNNNHNNNEEEAEVTQRQEQARKPIQGLIDLAF